MKYLTAVCLVAMLVFTGCHTAGRLSSGNLSKEHKYAVLPFTVRGSGAGVRVGYQAADRLSSLLFAKKRVAVIERSFINGALQELEIKDLYTLPQHQFLKIADTLNADVLILGLLDYRPLSVYESGQKAQMQITLRLLDSKTGNVLQIFDRKSESGDKLEKQLEKLLLAVIDKI